MAEDSSSNETPINYARYTGIESVPAAAIFCVLYVPFLLWFVRKSIARPTRVYIILSIFCIIRLVAFILRTILAVNESAGENLGLVIAELVLYNAGFFGLMYSASTLVLDRENRRDMSKRRDMTSRILRVSSNRSVPLAVAVTLIMIGTCAIFVSDDQNMIDFGNSLKKASIWMVLIVIVLLAAQTIRLARVEAAERQEYHESDNDKSFGFRHGVFILTIISALFLIREGFLTATVGSPKSQKEALWYPLVATTELICVMLFCTPGLVLPKADLPK